ETPLMEAARDGNMEGISRLIHSGANVIAIDNEGYTALDYALMSKHDNKNEIVWILLATGKFSRGALHSALSTTMYFGTNAGIIRMLTKAGADINYKDVSPLGFGKTLLMKSVEHEYVNPEFVKALISMGANVNAINNFGETPLIYAVRRGNSSVVEVLLNAGANVNTSDNDGKTPLMYVADYGTPQVVGMLLNAGANVNAKDNQGRKAVDYAKPAYFGWSGGNSRLKDSPVFKRLGESDLWLKSIW
ncbi:MAG: ankyrin repeat domain-containing protein, partial [Synergistaceae bacterium]|nr:ankyrin repeat domain-containing protein [Synergistaceae bacterium]